MFALIKYDKLANTTYLYEKSAVFWGITRRRVVNNYHTTSRKPTEDRRFHQHRGGSPKSRYLYERLSSKENFIS
jgi:hypothetical protein